MTTRQELEAENARLRELTAALIGMLAVIGDAAPPEPANDSDWRRYDAECARRLYAVTSWAEPSTEIEGGLTAEMIASRTAHLRTALDRPLHYAPQRQGEDNGTAPEASQP